MHNTKAKKFTNLKSVSKILALCIQGGFRDQIFSSDVIIWDDSHLAPFIRTSLRCPTTSWDMNGLWFPDGRYKTPHSHVSWNTYMKLMGSTCVSNNGRFIKQSAVDNVTRLINSARESTFFSPKGVTEYRTDTGIPVLYVTPAFYNRVYRGCFLPTHAVKFTKIIHSVILEEQKLGLRQFITSILQSSPNKLKNFNIELNLNGKMHKLSDLEKQFLYIEINLIFMMFYFWYVYERHPWYKEELEEQIDVLSKKEPNLFVFDSGLRVVDLRYSRYLE